MSSTAVQYRNEKKRIEEAVAKVREVVNFASKNDIILALHNFDLDVNRTIQAFCDDGAQSALDSWERSGSGGNKKKAQKKKKKGSAPGAAAENASTAISSSSSTQQTLPSKQLSSSNMKSNNNDNINGHVDFNEKHLANGDVKTKNVHASTASSGVHEVEIGSVPSMMKQSTPLAISVKQQSNLLSSSQNDGQFEHLNDDQKNKVLSTEISNLKSHGAEIDKIESEFENEVALAEQNIRLVFKSIRQLLSDREGHLLSEIKRTHDDGLGILNDTRLQSDNLNERLLYIQAMNDNEKDDLNSEILNFNFNLQNIHQMAYASRFVYDNTQIMNLIKNFGQVIGVKRSLNNSNTPSSHVQSVQNQNVANSNLIKHSTSHSSIVSSLGEDSGLGHISPVANDKHVVEVSNGGIHMKSDALSADELANLNKKLQETLRAQGIDESVLSGIGTTGLMPVRRRQAGPRAGYNNSGGAGRGGNPNALRRKQMNSGRNKPQLSILQS
ncbi:unnamed protein product [Anisakis simplex]|uniref:UBA domain-containing protein n=1 Tax=Anisakis simplex TaxID=6269 RepID=A0A0M3JYU9_ANISI|nr:unnamed protein product [Anisakis simplex]